MLDVAQAEAVVRNADRAPSGEFPGRIRDGKPAELRVIAMDDGVTAPIAVAKLAQIDHPQQHFDGRQRDDDDEQLQRNLAENLAGPAAQRCGRGRAGFLDIVGQRHEALSRAA
jgi:hypothetical protein